MKVVAILEVYFYDLSLRRAMDAARFFSLVDLSSFSSTCGGFFLMMSMIMIAN